jgi:hypothetical protein
MAKRKPPSQRPERKLDDVAKAIAQNRERETVDKSEGDERSGSPGPRQFATRGGRNGGHTPTGGPLPSPSTKRPKKPSV